MKAKNNITIAERKAYGQVLTSSQTIPSPALFTLLISKVHNIICLVINSLADQIFKAATVIAACKEFLTKTDNHLVICLKKATESTEIFSNNFYNELTATPINGTLWGYDSTAICSIVPTTRIWISGNAYWMKRPNHPKGNLASMHDPEEADSLRETVTGITKRSKLIY